MPKLLYRTTIPKPDDPDIIARFSQAVAIGHPVGTACTLAGMEQSTASRWLTQGEQESAAHEANGAEEPGSHVAFFRAFKASQAEFCARNLGVVTDAANLGGAKGWLPAMTLLERRMPQDFGRRTEVSVKSESVIVHVTATLSEATQAKVWAIAARAQKALPPPAQDDGESPPAL